MRRYRATFWVGDDHDEIEYGSAHRNGSRANREDAMQAIRRRKGRYIWERAELSRTWLVHD
jgi:hypothetical protein